MDDLILGGLALMGPVIVKTSVILAYALLVLRLAARMSAATRAAILACALLSGLLLPVFSRILPAWNASIPIPTVEIPAIRVGEASPTPTVPAKPSEKNAAPWRAPTAEALRSGRPIGRWLVSLWIVGFGLIVVRLTLAGRRASGIRRRSSALTDPEWVELLERCRLRMGLRRLPALRVAMGSMPTTWGVRYPTILIPAEASDWSADRRAGVLLHELAHVRRHDVLIQLLALLACCCYWFNPLFWAAYRRLLIEREQACDDLVLATGVSPKTYANDLLHTAVSFTAHAAPVACMARPNEMENRLMAILDPNRRPRGRTPFATLGVVTLSLALVVPLSTLAIGDRAEDEAFLPATANALRIKQQLLSREAADRRSAKQEVVQLGHHPDVRALAAELFRAYESDSALFQDLATFDMRASGASQEALLNALTSPFAVDRAAAAQALGRYPSDESVMALRGALLGDANWHVREWAARSLGAIGSRDAVPDLIEALGDTAVDVREWAARSLGSIGDPAGVRGLAISLEDEDSDVREWSARAIGSIGDPAGAEPLVAALSDPADNVREWAVRSLGSVGDREAAEAVAALLEDPNPEVRQWAMRSIPAMAAR